MAITAMTGLVPEWFTPAQPESDRPTRVKIRPLTGLENLEVSAEIGGGRIGDAQKIALRFGVVDWENVDDERGNPLPFSLENLKLLPVNVLSEIAIRIIRGSKMDDEKAKNYSSQSK